LRALPTAELLKLVRTGKEGESEEELSIILDIARERRLELEALDAEAYSRLQRKRRAAAGQPDLGDEDGSIPASYWEANAAFARARPGLLRERPGQFVAYRGAERLGFGATSRELWDRFGADVVVCSIEPEVEYKHSLRFQYELALLLSAARSRAQ